MTERDVMEFDVVIVGGGPAGLSTAIHLANLIERHNAEVEKSGQGSPMKPEICLIEKAAEIGAHSISGAVMDPKGLDALLPGWRTMEPKAPVEAEVHDDYAIWLSANGGTKFPITPPPLKNHGNFVVSLNKMVKWLGGIAEAKGIQVFPGSCSAKATRSPACSSPKRASTNTVSRRATSRRAAFWRANSSCSRKAVAVR